MKRTRVNINSRMLPPIQIDRNQIWLYLFAIIGNFSRFLNLGCRSIMVIYFTVIQNTIDYRVIADEVANRLIVPMSTEYNHQTVLGVYSQSNFAGDFLFVTRLAISLGIIEHSEENEFIFGTQFCHWAHAGCGLPLPLFFSRLKICRRYFTPSQHQVSGAPFATRLISGDGLIFSLSNYPLIFFWNIFRHFRRRLGGYITLIWPVKVSGFQSDVVKRMK